MICSLTRLDAEEISRHLRAKDRREVEAVTRFPSIEEWGRAVQERSHVSGCVRDLAGPVAMGGAVIQGHMASAWFVATPRISEPRLAVQGHLMALRLHRELELRGVKRAMAWVMESYKSSCRWLERLGYQREGRHLCWGIDGETFLSYARLKGGRS
jgi:hypothetical protein